MRENRHLRIVQLACLGVMMLAILSLFGCGGSSGGGASVTPISTKAGTGSATISVLWPKASRLVPQASNSINVVITQGTVVVAKQLLAKPAAGGTSTVSFPVLPIGNLTITATAYPNADGTGVAQATGSAQLVIVTGQNTVFSITMNSTITTVKIGPITVFKGFSVQVAAAAFDAAGNMVLTTPSKWTWTSSNQAAITVSPVGNPTTVTGLTVGSSVITATETESKVSASVTATVTLAGLASSSWPKFQGTLGNTGLSTAPSAGGTQKFAFTTGAPVYGSAAIGVDGTLYVGSSDGSLYAVDTSGGQKWKFTTAGQVGCPAVDVNGVIYIGSGDGKVYAINSNGSKKWEYKTANGSGILGNIALGGDGTIYAANLVGALNAIDANGNLKWSFNLGNFCYGTPAIGPDGTIYIGTSTQSSGTFDPGNVLIAFNPDGTTKWSFGDGYGMDASPAVAPDGTIYVGTYDNKLYALDTAGKPKWFNNFSQGGFGPISSPAIGIDGTVYFSSSEGNLYAVFPTGVSKWKFPLGGAFGTTPAIAGDGTVYVGYSDILGTTGAFYAVDPTGAQKWTVPNVPVAGSVAIGSDGVVYTPIGNTLTAIQ